MKESKSSEEGQPGKPADKVLEISREEDGSPSDSQTEGIQGVIYSFTIVSVGFGHMADRVPYALVMVEILKDSENLSNETHSIELGVVFQEEGQDIHSLAIGQRLKLSRIDPQIGKIFTTLPEN